MRVPGVRATAISKGTTRFCVRLLMPLPNAWWREKRWPSARLRPPFAHTQLSIPTKFALPRWSASKKCFSPVNGPTSSHSAPKKAAVLWPSLWPRTTLDPHSPDTFLTIINLRSPGCSCSSCTCWSFAWSRVLGQRGRARACGQGWDRRDGRSC